MGWPSEARQVFIDRPRAIWLLGLSFGSGYAALAHRHTELTARAVGFCLGIAGVVLVAKGLHDKAEMFQLPALSDRLTSWFRDAGILLRVVRRRNVIAVAAGSESSSSVGIATVGTGTTTPRTVEQRISQVEQELRDVRERARAQDDATRREFGALSKRVDEEKAERATSVKAIHDRLAELNVSNWDFEAVGLILVFVGSFLTTFPDCAVAFMTHSWRR
jgi:hypothetical protein